MRSKKNQITFWTDDEEHRRITENAKKNGLPTGTYLRLLGMAGIVVSVGGTIEPSSKPEVIRAVQRVYTPEELEANRLRNRRSA